jgi:hypothetical protein
MSNNPAEDAYNAGKSTISQEQAVGLRGKPSGMSPDAELNWVQKMTKQIHSYLTRKKKEGQMAPMEKMPSKDYAPAERITKSEDNDPANVSV